MRYNTDHHPREKEFIFEKDQQPIELVYRPPKMEEIENNPKLKANFEIGKKISEETQILKVNDAKSSSKTPVKKSTKIHSKPNKATMAKI